MTDFSSVKNSFTSSRFRKPNLPVSKNVVFVILGILVLFAIVFIVKANKPSSISTVVSNKPQAPAVKATQLINREFNFPIKDASGKEISKIKYVVESANLQDEILVKGERARAVKGRTFLIINLKINNTYKQGIQINSKDYIRLIVDDKKNELIAADIHNDPVEVQAIATKSTRLGFPIDETFKSLELQVGEINGSKESIKINFPGR